VFRWLHKSKFTLDFPPEASEKIKRICIVSDGELARVAGGSAEETDLVFSVESNAVTKTWKRRVAEDLQFLE
jgi:hypothetical protein